MNVREWALPVYTILMQLATGALSVIWIVRSRFVSKFGAENVDRACENSILVIFFTVAVAMAGSHFHLSKPHLSFLAVSNLGSSWLSREIFFSVLLLSSVGLLWFLQWRGSENSLRKTIVGWVAIFFGWANLYCMAIIYMLPTQIAWDTPITIVSFVCTALLLGIMALATLLIMDLKYSDLRSLAKARLQATVIKESLSWLIGVASFIVIIQTAMNISQLISLNYSTRETAQTSAMLLLRLYPVLFGLHLALIIVGVGGLASAVYLHSRDHKPVRDLLLPAYVTCLLVMVGEILGRFLFYAIHVRTGI
jgi:anaerobic dimethyl sulfoxide reductase subunit C (anchor subunit)